MFDKLVLLEVLRPLHI